MRKHYRTVSVPDLPGNTAAQIAREGVRLVEAAGHVVVKATDPDEALPGTDVEGWVLLAQRRGGHARVTVATIAD